LTLLYLAVFGALELITLTSGKYRGRCRRYNLLTVLSWHISKRVNEMEISG
jgi:hypothetical protein